MTKYQVSKVIYEELNRLNREIDRKIIQGISYSEESKMHKMLLAKLRRMVPEQTLLGRSMSFISTFVF